MVSPYRAMASEEVVPGTVSVLVLTYNTGSSLESCLQSVLAQSYPHRELVITDNASRAETRNRVERFLEAAEISIPVIIDWSQKNLGYSGGRNRGIRQSRGEYVLCLNHDVVLDEDFIELAVATMKHDSRIGAVQGKLLQTQNAKSEKTIGFIAGTPSQKRESDGKTQNYNSKLQTDQDKEIIDTTGLVAYKSRHFANRGHDEEDIGQYEKEEEVFGVDGAAPLYRRVALEDIRIPTANYELAGKSYGFSSPECGEGRASASANPEQSEGVSRITNYEYLDPDFFLYKEDIDLSWRLRLAGWKIVYQPKAKATNARTSKTGLNFLEARLQTPRRVRYFSFRNYHFLLLKNEGGWFFVAHLPWILARECGYLFISLLFELGNIVAVGDIIRLLPRMLRKRRIIMAHRRVEWREIYRWFK